MRKLRTGQIPRLLAVSAMAAATVIGLVQPAGATPRGPAAPPAAAGPDRGHADELISLVEAVPATFGGITFDQQARTATIRYDDDAGEPAARSRLGHLADQRGGVNRWRVVLQQVRHSLAELEAVRQKVAADPAWRAMAGNVLSEWYIDVERNRVGIGLTALTPEVARAAARTFGDLVGLYTATRGQRHTREDDFEPWTAGIRLRFPAGACTSGFVIRTVSQPVQRRLVSAGHCGPLGATVTNNGDLVGTVVERELAQNGRDYAHIGGRAYEAWMYLGLPTSDVGQPIRGTQLSAVGLGVCTNGATTGENCSGKVTRTNICVLFPDGITTCFLDEARSTNGSVLSAPGDSGGPVIAFDAGGLKVVGTIIGSGGGATWFHPFRHLVPAGWTVDFV